MQYFPQYHFRMGAYGLGIIIGHDIYLSSRPSQVVVWSVLLI